MWDGSWIRDSTVNKHGELNYVPSSWPAYGHACPCCFGEVR